MSEAPLNHPNNEKLADLAAGESTATNQVNPLERLKAEEQAERQAPAPSSINSELKKITLQRELQQVRRKLPARQRPLSRLIHQPLIRAVSETAAKSVSRPSGLLGGGLVAFLGSTGYLYLARHSGAPYNYFVFLVLFMGGFIVGLALEFAVYLATTSVRHRND